LIAREGLPGRQAASRFNERSALRADGRTALRRCFRTHAAVKIEADRMGKVPTNPEGGLTIF
jgi:hypothetical protein